MPNQIENILLMTIHYLGYTKDEIGLCSLSSYVRQFGYNVKLIGNTADKTDFDSIVNFHPQLIGATIYERTKKQVVDVLYKLKTMMPEVKICIGGPSVTFFAKELLELYPFIDYAVKGEGEITFLALLKALEKKEDLSSIKGLTYRDKDHIRSDNTFGEYVENLDTLPFPSRDLLSENKHGYAVIMGSRGCKGSCGFCYAPAFWKKWRGRTIQNIVDEIEYLKNTFSIDRIVFEDNSLEDPDSDCTRLKELAEEMIRRNLSILYDCNMRTEVYKKLDEHIVTLLKRSGLSVVFLGIESGNDIDLKKIYAKIATLNDNQKSLEYFKNNNIPVSFGFINFNPYSTFDNLRKNIEFLESNMAACSFRHIYSRYRMCRGTRLFKKITADGLFKANSDAIGEELSYSFVDSRIEKLVQYLERYFQDALLLGYFQDLPKKDKNYFEDIQLLFRVWYCHILSHLSRYFENNYLQKDLAMLLEYKQLAADIFSELNSINAIWFKNLLEFTETSWDEKEARNIIEEQLSPAHARDIYERLYNLKRLLNKELAHMNNSTVHKMINYIGFG